MGPGLEIIGFSSFRGFPDLDDAYVDWFRGVVAESGLVPDVAARSTPTSASAGTACSPTTS